MEDALLDAIRATRKVFAEISKGTDTQAAEEKALDVLWAIAIASYPRQAMVSCFKSFEMQPPQQASIVRRSREVKSNRATRPTSRFPLLPIC
jgi:hypothetical protein